MYHYRQRVMASFLTFFVLVMLIPIVVLTPFFYIKTSNTHIENFTSQLESRAYAIAQDMEKDRRIALSVRDSLLQNPYFYEYRLQAQPGSFVYIRKALDDIRYTVPFGADMGFYSCRNKMFYSTSIYNRDYYLMDVLCLKDEFQSEINQVLETALEPVIIHDSQSVGSPAWMIVPFEIEYRETPHPLSHLVYQIPSAYFQSVINQMQPEGADSIGIWIGEDLAYESGPAAGRLTSKDSFQICQSYEDITIIMTISKAYISSSLMQLTGSYLVALIMSLIFGCFVIFLFVHKHYTPIVSLSSTLNSVAGRDELSQSADIFRTADSTLKSLIKQNRLYTKKIQEILRDKFLYSLIFRSTRSVSTEDVLTAGKTWGITFSYTNFIVFVLEIEDANRFGISETVAEAEFYSCDYPELNLTIFVVDCKEPSYQVVEKIIQYVLTDGMPANSMPSKIGVGSFGDTVQFLSTSYIQALQALDSCDTLHKNIVYFEETEQRSIYHYNTCSKLIEAFCKAIMIRDNNKMSLASQNLCSILAVMNDSIACSSICLEFLFKVSSTLSSDQIPFIKETIEKWKRLLLHHENAAQPYIKCIQELEKSIMDEFDKNPPFDTPGDHLGNRPLDPMEIENIMSYIANHLLDSDLSVANVAFHFHTSQSNISHYFKKKTGTTLLEYINTLKINMVKKMLVETDLTISEIANKVGYFHSSSLIKRFKNMEGTTPAEYRAYRRSYGDIPEDNRD